MSDAMLLMFRQCYTNFVPKFETGASPGNLAREANDTSTNGLSVDEAAGPNEMPSA
jgi:hypothetical protein